MFGNCFVLWFIYYVSEFTVEAYWFADGLCIFKQARSVCHQCNQYDEEISKKCRSVCLSVRPFVALRKAYSSIIKSRITTFISGEKA